MTPLENCLLALKSLSSSSRCGRTVELAKVVLLTPAISLADN